jgi:hypothetical protein
VGADGCGILPAARNHELPDRGMRASRKTPRKSLIRAAIPLTLLSLGGAITLQTRQLETAIASPYPMVRAA